MSHSEEDGVLLSQLTGTVNVDRETLTFLELMSGVDPASPVDDCAFALPDEDAHPDHIFEGKFELFGVAAAGGFLRLKGDSNLGPDVSHIP